MTDKQVINILMNMMWDNFGGEGEMAVAWMVNAGIPANVIADYYGASETAELLQKAKDSDLLDERKIK